MRTKSHSDTRRTLLAAGLFLLAASPSFGATFYYGGGDAVWSAHDWASTSGGTYTGIWTNGNTAVFEGTSGTVTLDSTITAAGITFTTDGHVIQGSDTLTITGPMLNVLGNNASTANITLGASTTVSSDAGTLTLAGITSTGYYLTLGGAGHVVVNGVIATGNSALTKTGSGTVTLNGANTYSNITTISGGVLEVGVLGNSNVATGIGNAGGHYEASYLVIDGGVLRYTGAGNASTDKLFTLTANNGGFDVASGAGALTISRAAGAVAYTGTNTANTLTLGASNTGGNVFGLTIGNNGSGATSVKKTGEGKWILSASNAYTGATLVSGGTLVVTGSIANSATTVQSDGTLAGTGTVGGITLNAGGFVAPGSDAVPAGTLTASSLLWDGGGTLQFTLGAISDKLTLTGALTKGSDGVYLFDFMNSSPDSDTYTLVAAGGGFGVFDESDFSFTNLGDGLTGSFHISGNNLDFTVMTAVPEPAAYGLCGAGILAGITFVRRRRRV